MVTCLLCNKELGMITESHMQKFHEMGCKEYLKTFNLKKGEINPHHSKNMTGQGNPRYGIIIPDELKQKIRNIHKMNKKFNGKGNPMFGKTHSLEVRKKISEFNKVAMKGKGNSFYGRKHSIKTRNRISAIRIELGLARGKNNPLFGKGHTEETRKKQSEIKKEFFLKYPEKHPNSLIVINYKEQNNKKGGYISKKQKEIYELIKIKFPDAQLNYPIKTKEGLYFADIGIPSQNLDIEYDGEYWHNKEKDEKRDTNITNSGWKEVRLKDKDVDKYDEQSLLDHIYQKSLEVIA